MKEKADEWKKILKEAEAALIKAEEVSEATEGCLKGKAGTRIREQIKKRRHTGEGFLRELFCLAEKLEKIALEYAGTERSNQDVRPGN